MFLATYPVRFLPIVWFNKKTLSPALKTWLSFVPVVVFSSLLAQMLFDEKRDAESREAFYPFILGVLTCGVTTYYTKSNGIGMLVGIATFAFSVFFFC